MSPSTHWHVKHRDSEWLKNSSNDFTRLADEALETNTPESIACLERMIRAGLVAPESRFFLPETCLAFPIPDDRESLLVCLATRRFRFKNVFPCPRESVNRDSGITPQTLIYFEQKRPWPKCKNILREYHTTGRVRGSFQVLKDALKELETHALDDLKYEIDYTLAVRFCRASHDERLVIQTALKSVWCPVSSIIFEAR